MTTSSPRGKRKDGGRPAARKPEDLRLEGFLSYRLSRLNFLIGRATAAAYTDEGLSSHQWKVMSVLHHYAPMSASAIKPWVTFDKSAISHAVQHLLKTGLVERRLHERDGRAAYIELTPKGREVSARTTARIAHVQQTIFESVPPRQLAALFPLLDNLDAAAHSFIDQEAQAKE